MSLYSIWNVQYQYNCHLLILEYTQISRPAKQTPLHHDTYITCKEFLAPGSSAGILRGYNEFCLSRFAILSSWTLPEREMLGQLVVTPEVVASKINNMKENESPGVDGISPKILKEIVEQISTPLAHMFLKHVTAGGNCTFRMERSKHHSFIQKRFKKQVCKL